MTKDKTIHGTVLDDQSREQPDKGRAQTATKTEPSRMPRQSEKEDALQPLKEKRGF